MTKFRIVNEPDTGKIWLLNLDTDIADPLDPDVLALSGAAGDQFIQLINDSSKSLRISADRRGDPSERLSSASPLNMKSEIEDHRSVPSDRSYFFDVRNGPLDRSFSANAAVL